MRKYGILIVLAAVVGMIFSNTALASADGVTIDPNNPEATTIVLQDVAKVDISKVRVNAEYVGEWVMVDKTSVDMSSCFWTKPGERWTNSATGVGFYPEFIRAKLCKSSESSTGWVKVAGGKTGSPCYNPSIPPFKLQPKLKIKRVLDVKNLNNFGFKVHAKARALIDLQGNVGCPSGSFSVHLRGVAGSKSGGWFRVKIASRVLIQNHGKVNGRVKVAIRNALRAQLAAEAAAEALGTLTYKCGQTLPPCSTCHSTPPPEEPPCGCVTEKSIRITSWTEMNDIPVGKSSDNFHVGVYTSDAGGSLTIDPGVGGVNVCGSTQPVITTYVVSLQKGNNDVCVKLFAPQDTSATSMTVTALAVLGNKSDERSQTFLVSHPVRP